MKKIMLVAGSSDLAGSEIDGTEDSAYNRQNSFGNLLAAKLGYEAINIAIGGSTNQGITRSVIEWFDKNYDPTTMEVFVLVGWTESLRMEVPSPFIVWYEEMNPAVDWFSESSRKFLRVNMGWAGNNDEERELVKYYHEFMASNQTYLEIVSANCVLELQYFCKMHKVKYLMCNTLHMFERNIHTEFYLNQIDSRNYINYDNNTESFFWKYRNAGYENPKAKYWHHNEVPHSLYSEILYNFIQAAN